jgi:Rieske 2Fe-2S family protein
MLQTQSVATFRKTAETFTAGAKTLPQEYFVSPDTFAREQSGIFANHWILAGHQSHLSKPGDFFVIRIAGESLIVIKDQSRTIRAFYNVCRHRGTRLCETEAGRVRAIQCPYHAWTYGLDGKLIGAPHMDGVPGFDKADYSLHSVNVGIWEGFIFVNLAKTAVSLDEWFAPLAGKFSHWNLSNLRSAKQVEYDVRANWKLIFENYSECYHCPGVHPALSKISPYDSAENDLTEGPFLGGFMKITKGKSLTMSGNACAIPVDLATASPSGGGQEEEHRVFYYSIFPNMLLSMHPDYVMVHQLWPQAPDRTLIDCHWFFHPDAAGGKDFKPEDAVEFWDITNKQDWHVCALSQQGIASRAYQSGPYSSRESIPAAWDRYYLEQMGPR